MSTVDPITPHSRRRSSMVTALAVVVAALAGVIYALVAPTTVHSQSPGASAPRMALPVASQVLPSSLFPGLIRTTQPMVVHSAAIWATTVAEAHPAAPETERLRRLGFVAGVDEHLYGRFPSQAEAISIVEQYRSAVAARTELAYQRTRDLSAPAGAGQRLTLLRAIGIPGATGWEVRGAQSIGINVMFSSGPSYYLVGAGFTPGTHKAPTTAEVIAGAQFLYLLVHGCVSPAASGRGGWPGPTWDPAQGRIVNGLTRDPR